MLPSERSAWITETTAQINRMLAERYKDDQSVAFLDLTALFMRNGTLNRDLFLDPHADAAGPAAASVRSGPGAHGKGDGAGAGQHAG